MKAKKSLSASHITQYFSPNFQVSSQAKIHCFACLDSTNTWLKDNGECGDVCIAEQQTAGRGRRGKQWLSPNVENIYCSVKWCFKSVPAHLSLLSLVVGLSIVKALEKIGLTEHGVKWPNDIFWHQQKMGGVLIEAISSSSKKYEQQVVIGFGLNVNMPESAGKLIDQPWVSLNNVLGVTVNRHQLLAYVLESLTQELRNFEAFNIQQFQHDWQCWDVLKGKEVRVLQEQQEGSGIVEGIDGQGRIAIKLISGEVKYYTSAEIRLKK